jgi:membrane protease YdiL (CAAX protease family)
MHDVLPGTDSSESIVSPPSRSTAAVAPRWHTALIILLLAGGSFLNARQAHHAGLDTHHAQRYLGGIVGEGVLFLLTWWGLRMRRVSIAEVLGFRRGWRALGEDLGAAAIFWIVSLIVLASIGVTLQKLNFGTPQKTLAALAPQSATEMLLWIGLSASAGFCEEFVFRGYFLRQFASPLHRLWLGVVGSSLIFGLAHAYEGAAGMIAIAAFGALFCGLAILRNSLRPGMIAHAWHDIFSGAMLALVHHFHLL